MTSRQTRPAMVGHTCDMADSPARPAAARPQAAMVVSDTDGVIVSWYQAAEELTGHSAAAAVGSSLDLIVPTEYRQRHWAGFHAAMASGKARAEGAAANIPVLVMPADDDPPLFNL